MRQRFCFGQIIARHIFFIIVFSPPSHGRQCLFFSAIGVNINGSLGVTDTFGLVGSAFMDALDL
jgi:hypothetical protein